MNADFEPSLDDFELDVVGGVLPVGEPFSVDALLQMRLELVERRGRKNLKRTIEVDQCQIPL